MNFARSESLNQPHNGTVEPDGNGRQRTPHNQWGIILAGGEGERMKPFIQKWLGIPKPKQYCAFVGERSMLQHTWDRVDRAGDPEKKVTIIDQSHSQEIFRHMQAHTKGHLVIQPRNCETAAGVFLALTYIHHWDPEAIVTIYPSDHFIAPQEPFIRMVQAAASTVTRFQERIILLGAVPNSPEGDYGWIRPGQTLRGATELSVRSVEEFVEKPGPMKVEQLRQSGGIWSTMIILAYGRKLWALGEQCFPNMMKLFHQLRRAIGSPQETQTLKAIYREMPRVNFSKIFLENMQAHLATIELEGVLWSDWGRPERIIETLTLLRKDPAFPIPQYLTS